MKKRILFVLTFIILSLTNVLASCDISVSMVNQDPHPAVPGDYVKILFQVSGVASQDCGDITFELLENYPIRFDPNFNPIQTLKAGTFSRGYNSNWIVPYNVRIDQNALDGDAEIEVSYKIKGINAMSISKMFNITIKEVRADFDVFVRSYDYSSSKLVLEILNTAKNDVQSVVLSIPSQEGIRVIGGNKNIVGDLDSNDYTSTEFGAILEDGIILVEVEYTDTTGERRFKETEVLFESKYFEHTVPSNSGVIRNTVISIVILSLVILGFIRKKKKKVF